MKEHSGECNAPRKLVAKTCSFWKKQRRRYCLDLTFQIIVVFVLLLLLLGCALVSQRSTTTTKIQRGLLFKPSEAAKKDMGTAASSLDETSNHHQQRRKQQEQEPSQLPSPTRPKTFFVTYGSGVYSSSMARLVQEAMDTGEFDTVYGFTREDIEQNFADANAGILNQERGDGYWLWKPYFVWRVMQEELQAGDVLFYADAGCEFKGSPRRYLDLARRYGFLGFRLPFVVKHWTKGDVFRALDMDMEMFGDERQMVGGIFAMMKTPTMTRFVREWLLFSNEPHLIDDSPSVLPNAPGFVEHRHDQAIFTLLVYKYGLAVVLEDETDKVQYRTGLAHLMSQMEYYKESRVILAARGKNDRRDEAETRIRETENGKSQ